MANVIITKQGYSAYKKFLNVICGMCMVITSSVVAITKSAKKSLKEMLDVVV